MDQWGWTWSLLTLFYLAQSTQEKWDGRNDLQFRPHHYDHRHWGPFFEDPAINATGLPKFSSGGIYAMAVPAGGSLHLDCRVAMLQDKLVTWVKKTAERVSLLTVGTALYSADSRYSLKFLYPNNWRLEISPVLEGDDGLYMCQLSTHPPKVLATNLTVLSPEVMVSDEHGDAVSERHYREGSRVDLQCKASLVTPPKTAKAVNAVVWQKDGQTTQYQLKPAVNLPEEGSSITTIYSRLLIPQADRSDSGTYSCILEDRITAKVTVHILQGETQAAVYHEGSTASKHHSHLILAATLFLSL